MNRSCVKKTGCRLLALCMLFALAAAFPLKAAAAEPAQTVRIAFYPLDGFFEYDENGNECGYGVDYLNELAKYENIHWEYVPADSWEEIKYMMLDGKVDVRMPVSAPLVPSELYDYTVDPMLMTYHAIMTRKDRTDLYYQDYDTISGLKIAACTSLMEKTGVTDYLDSIGASDNLVFYPDYNSCRAALDDGTVDALISNVMDLTDDLKILDKFMVVNNYITTLKGNPRYAIINRAQTQMRLKEPSFETALYEKYFPERANEPFTKEESEYIAQTDHLTVAVYNDRKPVSYQDADGNFHGIAIDMANLLSERIGIPFVYIPVTTATQTEMLPQADLVMPVPTEASNENIFVTQSMLNPEILFAVRGGTETMWEGAPVGVLKTTPGILKIMQGLGKFHIVEYSSSREALSALQEGEIDAFANSSYVLDWMLKNPRYSDLSTLRYESLPLDYCISGRADNTVLESLLEKSLQSITDEERNTILQDDSKLSMDDFNALDGLYLYRTQIAATGVVLMVLVLFAVIYNSSRSRYIAQIEESNRRQEKASRAKSEFLSRMSHDMRTPLNVIIGMSHLAYENKNPPDTEDCLHKIDISSEFLLGLINDVLDMEHIESGRIVLHPVPYSGEEFSQYISAVIQPLCAQKNIDFRYTRNGPADFVVMQDKLRINQVYFNLLSNAAKFTPEGGRITFHTDMEETNHGTICMDVTIADTGIGMSREFMEHMFEPFSQENQVLKPISQGTGLGLSIVKRICDLMHMTISAQSELGHGTTFTLHGEYEVAPNVPAAPAEVQPAVPADIGTTLKGKIFLVCEDHPLNQEIIRRLLEKKQAVVVLADNGRRGVEAFEHTAPGSCAAILMDVRMPVMDGIEATRAIRALPRRDAASVPILALTANAYEEDVQKCLDAGMNAHLAKPIEPDELYRKLAQYTAQK